MPTLMTNILLTQKH